MDNSNNLLELLINNDEKINIKIIFTNYINKLINKINEHIKNMNIIFNFYYKKIKNMDIIEKIKKNYYGQNISYYYYKNEDIKNNFTFDINNIHYKLNEKIIEIVKKNNYILLHINANNNNDHDNIINIINEILGKILYKSIIFNNISDNHNYNYNYELRISNDIIINKSINIYKTINFYRSISIDDNYNNNYFYSLIDYIYNSKNINNINHNNLSFEKTITNYSNNIKTLKLDDNMELILN
jgi:hypothetical protein